MKKRYYLSILSMYLLILAFDSIYFVLNQVFMNIIMNAIQSIEEKGEIDIKTYSDEEHIGILCPSLATEEKHNDR